MPQAAKQKQGTLRAALLRELERTGPAGSGLPVSALAARTGWSESAVRRELGLMEQLDLAWFYTPDRTMLWHLTREHERETGR